MCVSFSFYQWIGKKKGKRGNRSIYLEQRTKENKKEEEASSY